MKALLPPRSTAERDTSIESLAATAWDLLVVGGGITGVAVARDAASRGLKTAVIEQGDFAFGTSSRSSRLIHGGLRYLANLDFGLVREGLIERRRLLDAAPGLVHPVRFLYPVYRGDPDPVWKVNLGVALYEALAFGYGLGGRKRLSAKGVADSIPGLRRDDLRGGVSYFDAATNDTRLTLAVALAARRAGATLASRCRAEQLDGSSPVDRSAPNEPGRTPIGGAIVQDLIGKHRIRVRSRATVLCCGPWQKLFETTPVRLRTARGSHLSIRNQRIPLDCFTALRSPRDGRLAFAMPIDNYIILGTTDDDDDSAPGEVRPTEQDTEYLLELANHAFPSADVGRADVTGAWAGLRPLLADGSGEHADELSRHHKVVAAADGLWILTGGKLTTHRRMAEDCLDAIAPTLEKQGLDIGPCKTAKGQLLDGSTTRGRARLASLGVEQPEIESLAAVYGSRLEGLAATLDPGRMASSPDSELLAKQIQTAVADEWALSLDDLLLRRIAPGALDLRGTWQLAPRAGREMGRHLAWSEQETKLEVEEFRAGVARDLSAAGAPLPSDSGS